MTQEATQLPTTPPYPGLQMVQDINKLAQTLGTDFAGDTDPASIAWPYAVWADTGTNTIKRRNAADSAWAIEGRLFRVHVPIIPLVDVPDIDIGPIHIIGVGPAEWGGAAYKAMISGLPGATFSEIDALTEDDGPIICTDMGGYIYVWTQSAYFEGYRNPLCGTIPQHFAPTPRAWEMSVTGGVWSESDPKQKRLIALFREYGHVVDVGSWAKGWGRIADLGGGDWKAPDLQDVFLRVSGTDADTANPASVGFYQADAMQRITGSTERAGVVILTSGSGAFSGKSANSQGLQGGNPLSGFGSFDFDSANSPGARTSVETRVAGARVSPVILI